MKIYLLFFFIASIVILEINVARAQGKIFKTRIDDSQLGEICSIKQDSRGYIWFSAGLGRNVGRGGIYKYDGRNIISYQNDPRNANSLASNWAECIYVDPSDIIWIGTFGSGLDRFDPTTNTFTHFRHQTSNASSLSNDTVQCILPNKEGNLWIGTKAGLNLFDVKTGKCKRFVSNPSDPSSLSSNNVRVLYEDRQGILWIGCGTPFPGEDATPEEGGLNRLEGGNGRFTHYLHDPHNPNSIANNKVRAIFEDSKGNLWVGTAGDGLHTLDRATGNFTHYYYDSLHPGKLSRPLFNPSLSYDQITFITEDVKGAIWIGTLQEGINKYDPATKELSHYGYTVKTSKTGRTALADTVSGLSSTLIWNAFIAKDGLMWICSLTGWLATVDLTKLTIPYYQINSNTNSFYFDAPKNVLWIGTDDGLVQQAPYAKVEKKWVHDPRDSGSLSDTRVSSVRVDADGKLWVATLKGLNKFDPLTNTFKSYWPNQNDRSSVANSINNLLIDHSQNIWLATELGAYKMDHNTGKFTAYVNDKKDSANFGYNKVLCLAEDRGSKIWLGTARGVNRLDDKTGKFQSYLTESTVKSVFVDATGTLWVGSDDALYRYNETKNIFSRYIDPNTKAAISSILHIMEDDKKNLWVATTHFIARINPARDSLQMFGESYGVHRNGFFFADNHKAANGELFFGDQLGYYAFFPGQLTGNNSPPQVSLTNFKLADREVKPSASGILSGAIWNTTELKLTYKQNIFSFEFEALDYRNDVQPNFLFKLENYDNNWRPIGADRRAYLFNIPPGKYIFHIRAVNADGLWGEKKINITITPPWYKTWWAYTIFGLTFISTLWAFIGYRSAKLRKENSVLEARVKERTLQLQTSLENLKLTQGQLVQQEKMASLGELTAGIAHEIQNPLNFVNNFSEINKEMIAEMQQEIDKGNYDEAKLISNDIGENEQKINYHGRRAEAIVKSMLEHSRKSSGKKEPTDINALADEYLRLSYHGLRAKDKSFNAKFESNLDKSISKINIVPQDMGRVLLNLINNAFYAVAEKKQKLDGSYEPTVSVTTRRITPSSGDGSGKVEIKVTDNGNGIPEKVITKIFHPFFTTKPTGQGTGLGLSLSYDIIKAHGGEIKVETKEGEGSEFTIQLPSSS